MRALKAKESRGGTPGGPRPLDGRRKKRKVVYPESDGKPMADNTKQYEWIVKIKENLECVFADDPNVFVAADLLWYPVEGDNKTRAAPDVMVAFGRPKGHRGSYRTWDEDGVAPQVVFEILSPGNRKAEMDKKFKFYEKHGVEEYYIYDPDHLRLAGHVRSGKKLIPIENMQGWVSPLLKIRFDMGEDDLHLFDPNGQEFLTPLASKLLDQAKIQAEIQRAESAEKLAKEEKRRTEMERREKERLAAKLRELGINPDQL